jgi:hypothetical protein
MQQQHLLLASLQQCSKLAGQGVLRESATRSLLLLWW